MIVAIYLRKSRAEDATEAIDLTLKKHNETLMEFANLHNYLVKDIYKEVVSGESLYLRPEMLKLLQNVEKGLYDAVLCMDIDRLGRGTMSEQGIILETFKNSQTQIITPRKTYNLNNEIDEEYTEFESFIARRELKIIKRRMKQGIERSVLDGCFLSCAPYGYTKTTISKQSSLKINNKEAFFVKMIFDLYINKGLGCQAIADTINSLGAVSHNGNKFSRTSILHIIKNQVYIGKIVWNQRNKHQYNPKDKFTVVDGIHPKIIDTETFFKAQQIIKERSHPPAHKSSIQNPFSGILICSICGHLIQRRNFKSKNDLRLICLTKDCVKSEKLKTVENTVINAIRPYLEKIQISVNKKKNAKISNKKLLISINSQRKKLTIQLSKIHSLFEQNIYDYDTYIKRKSTIETELKTLDETNSILKEQLLEEKDTAEQKISVFELYKLSDAKIQNLILKSTIKSICYYKAKDWSQNKFELLIKMYDLSIYHEQDSSAHES